MAGPFSIFFCPTPQLRPTALFGQPVGGVAQRAILQGQAATANTFTQLIAQLRQAFDARIQICPPELGQALPILRRGRAVARQRTQRLLDLRQRNTSALGDFDHRDTPQNAARIAPLIAGGAPTADQTATLIEMQSRYRDTTAACDIANGHFAARRFVCVIHLPPLDLMFT